MDFSKLFSWLMVSSFLWISSMYQRWCLEFVDKLSRRKSNYQKLSRLLRLAVYIRSWPVHCLCFTSDSVKLYLLCWRQPSSSYLIELWHSNTSEFSAIINLLLFFSFILFTLLTVSYTLSAFITIEVKDLTTVINTISYYQMSYIIIIISDL